MINLRKVTVEDAENLLKWKNEEDTRRNSIVTGEIIKLENHLEWLKKTLTDPTVQFWIIEDDGVPVGDLRLNHGETESEISIRLDKSCRGKGLATAVIGMVECPKRLVAKIVAHNLASMRVFISNGYKPYEYICGKYDPVLDKTINYYIFKK